MTENEREEILKDIRDGYIDAWDNLTIDELFKAIEKEHEEIQAYRAIGTVEELQALKEKAEPKKPRLIGNAMICPSCPKVYSSDRVTCCINCGQKLDWE